MALFRVNVYDSNDELDKNIVSEGIAGENISSGDLCYLNNDGKFWKANASSINTSGTELRLAKENLLADESGKFYVQGTIASSGLTVGVRYYLSTTDGQISTVRPTQPLSITRYVGTASATDTFEFNPMDISTDSTLDLQVVSSNGSNTTLGITTGGLVSDGDLEVSESSKTTLSNDVEIKDSFPIINSDQTGTPTEDAGITVNRGSSDSRSIKWSESAKKWQIEKSTNNWAAIGVEYEHDQGMPSASWSIQHNLDKYPSCVAVSSNGTTVIGEVDFTDRNNLTLIFSSSFSGKAFLN